MKYKTWECKIVVPLDVQLPYGFDSPPRRAAIDAVTRAGVPVLACFSGWGGELTATPEVTRMETAEQTIESTEEVGAVSMSPSTALLAVADGWDRTASALEFLNRPIQATRFRVLASDVRRKLNTANASVSIPGDEPGYAPRDC